MSALTTENQFDPKTPIHQAKERAKATLSISGNGSTRGTSNAAEESQVDSADCLIEDSGASLFDGDIVSKVLSGIQISQEFESNNPITGFEKWLTSESSQPIDSTE